MSNDIWPSGLMTALVTPMREDTVDLEATRALIERQVQAGVSGVIVSGGTGEHGVLTFDERRSLFREVADALDGRLPFVAQSGALATKDAVAMSEFAQDAGAFGLLLPSPFGEAINWRERVAYYNEVSRAVSIPIMLYNSHSAGTMSLEQIETVAALPNVSAIKQSSTDVMALGDLLGWAAGHDFTVYIGEDSLLTTAMLAGAHGAVLGTGNVIPEALIRVLQLCQGVELTDDLRTTWALARPVIRFMEKSENYVALCKLGLRLRGLDVGDTRAPYLMPSAEAEAEFAELLNALDAGMLVT